MSAIRVVMIDNYDSFTYNLVQYLGELGAEVTVVRNDQVTVADIVQMRPDKLVISPGPCTPKEAGISVEAINYFAGRCHILGVCLGHQSIACAFGGQIIHAQHIMHGKTSKIYHCGKGVFKGLKDPFQSTRYHSLVIARANLPACFELSAWTQNADGSIEEIMGIRHKEFTIEGVQFHPESILSEHGHDLLGNFLAS